MSAPNKQYDPVEVASLSPGEISRMRDEALAAIAAATTLDELKAARLAHAGDRSPLRLANAEIGALPPGARAEAGKRVGAAMREVNEALGARQQVLEEERDQRVLIEEAVDVTLPWDHQPHGAGTRSPRSASGCPTFSCPWATRSPKALRSRTSGTTSMPSTSRPTIRPGICRTPCSWPGRTAASTRAWCCARTPRRLQIRAMLTRPLPLYVVSPGRCYRK